MGSVLTLPTFLLGWGAVRWGGGDVPWRPQQVCLCLPRRRKPKSTGSAAVTRTSPVLPALAEDGNPDGPRTLKLSPLITPVASLDQVPALPTMRRDEGGQVDSVAMLRRVTSSPKLNFTASVRVRNRRWICFPCAVLSSLDFSSWNAVVLCNLRKV